MLRRIATATLLLATSAFAVDYPSLQQVDSSTTDILGDMALQQPDGPSYEFFANAMPPLRYVDTRFKCYPIVLSAPSNPTKARLVSDGSSINARERSLTWSKEQGTPVYFFMGDKREPFGQNLANLSGPKFVDGYLPIVQMTYKTQGAEWEQESFCSTDPKLADYGVVFVKFTLKSATPIQVPEVKIRPERWGEAIKGVQSETNAELIAKPYDDKVEAFFEGPAKYELNKQDQLIAPAISGEEAFAAMKEGKDVEKGGKVLSLVSPRAITNAGRGALIQQMKIGDSSYFAIFTKNADPSAVKITLTAEEYNRQRATCAKTWNDILNAGANFQTPETIVNNCWRAQTIMDYMLITGDAMHYSACNQYDGIYIGEGGDAIYTLGLYGHFADAQRLEPAQFKSQRAGLQFHRAAFKLQMLCRIYALTKDADFVKQLEPMWQKELNIILKGREPKSGMLPKEQYCGDVHEMVYSLNSNANCWRALRDMSILCKETGRTEQAQQLATTAAEYRKIILATLDKVQDHSVNPPFIPIALGGEEDPHVPIWGTTIGSYWNLMIHYVLASGVFPANSQTAGDVVKYVEQNGGLCMGMLRARATSGNYWVTGGRLNDLYGMRHNLTLLQRDDVDHTLVCFYGKLAQGCTRDTFIGCEGSSIGSVDQFGRQMSLPPNSAANSNFLQTLRFMLVQDYDLDDDGHPETLRLLFATPRAWLSDGQEIRIVKAPTQFGAVSVDANRKGNQITADITLPKDAPKQSLIRFRLPHGQHLASASTGKLLDNDTIDITGSTGTVHLTAEIK